MLKKQVSIRGIGFIRLMMRLLESPCECGIVVLRRIFGPNRDENEEWRRLHNEELHSLYLSPNIARVIKSRRLRWAGNVARMEEGRSIFKILTGKPTGKRPFGDA